MLLTISRKNTYPRNFFLFQELSNMKVLEKNAMLAIIIAINMGAVFDLN